MFAGLARFVVYNPWKVIAAWLIAAVAVIAFAPTLSDVLNREQTNFLPDKYESIQAQNLAKKAFAKTDNATVMIVAKRTDGQQLSQADQDKVAAVAAAVKSVPKVQVSETGPQSVSENRQIQLVNVVLDGLPTDESLLDTVKEIRVEGQKSLQDSGVSMAVTGDIALYVDNADAFEKAFVIVGTATVVLIVILLALIYRSVLAAIVPLVSVGIVSMIAPGIIATVAKATDLQVDQNLQIILSIVLYGVGTDYILFLLFRYRELLRAGMDSKQALVTAVERVSEVILSAAGAIIVAFLALLLAIFGAFRSLGPALAIAVALMAVASLTLIPAFVSLVGTKVFWPSKSWQREPKGTFFAKLGDYTARKPVVVAVISGGLLVLLALGMTTYKTDFDQFSQLPSDTESARGFKDLQSGFPAGALNPTLVYVQSTDGQPIDQAEIDRVANDLKSAPGVGAVMPGPTGALGLLSNDGKTGQITLSLTESPYANAALDTIEPLRDKAHEIAPANTDVLVGGPTAAFADVRDANNRDLRVIFPVAGILIAIILGLLLRSVVAPLYLMASVVLVFFSTMGATAFLATQIQDRVGVTFSLPIILYLFVVAIGTDYNILMIARLREEAREGKEPRDAARLGVAHGGPSVTSAGLILAGTFASMMLGGIAFLTEMGFSVALGIVLSSMVMSLFFVPSLTALLGHAAWWPGHGDAVRDKPQDLEPAKV